MQNTPVKVEKRGKVQQVCHEGKKKVMDESIKFVKAYNKDKDS